jgi:hypothetical protein
LIFVKSIDGLQVFVLDFRESDLMPINRHFLAVLGVLLDFPFSLIVFITPSGPRSIGAPAKTKDTQYREKRKNEH